MNNFRLSEEDLQHIFASNIEKPKKTKKIIIFGVMFLVIFGLIFLIVNISAITKSFNYWYYSDFKAEENYGDYYPESVVNISPTESVVDVTKSLPEIPNNNIIIPKISAKAPVSWKVKNTESEVQDKLQKGVVHLANTAIPGQNGNVFITGHSSNYFWVSGSYKDIFALLNKLVIGDLIYINYNKTVYIYKTVEIKTVKPTDLSVMNSNDKPELTLMTCTPVGTSINRLIIKSSQISPNTNNNTKFDGNTISNSALKGVR